MFFERQPGVPAINRWASAHPFIAYVQLFAGVQNIGRNTFLETFDGEQELQDSVAELDLSPEELYRVQHGKRMRRVMGMLRNNVEHQALSLSAC